MQTKTIGLVIVIAAILYIMYHHNNITANMSGASSGGGGFLGFLGNPLGVGSGSGSSGGGGGGGTTLGGIGHNYANDPAACLTCAGVGTPRATPTAPIRYAPIDTAPAPSAPVYTPPVPVASQAPAPSGYTTFSGSNYNTPSMAVTPQNFHTLTYAQLLSIKKV